jgi:HK97 family phage portal protein
MAGSDTQPGWEDMTKNSIEYLGLIGNAYWKIELDTNGLPARLIPLQAEQMQVGVDKYGIPAEYIYQPTLQGGNAQVEQVRYKPSQIIHYMNRSPGNTLYSLGKGKLEACIDAASLYQFMDSYEQYLNRNMARPDVVVSYKGAPSEAEMKAVMAMWNKAFRGEQNSGKPLVTSGDVDVKNLGFAPRDMQFQIGRQWAKKVILATYGVPEALVEINDANYASSYSAMSHFTEYTIHPELSAYLAVFNRRVTRLYDPNLVLWYDEQVASDPQTQSAIVNTSFVNGIISRGEAREALGYGAEADDSANLEQSQGQTGAQA